MAMSGTGEIDSVLGAKELAQMSCEDFGEFKEALKTLRLIDDKIIYELNTSIPTQSFKHEVDAESKCRSLYQQLLDVYSTRESAIKNCIMQTAEQVKILKDEKMKDPDDIDVLKKLRKAQTSLRLMQSELSVEEVVKQRSLKVYNERCWKSYKPPKEL